MAKDNLFVVAMDTGNGELKIVSDAVKRLAVGGFLGRYVDGTDGKTKISRNDDLAVYQVESELDKWVIGYEDVAKSKAKPVPVVARDGITRYTSEVFKRYAKIGLAKAVGKKRPAQILLVTSTPAQDYLNKNIIQKLDETLRDVHKVRQNDERMVLNVTHYEPMSETEAVLYDLYLDTEGGVADDSVENQDILVINAGYGTTDISFYSNLEYIKLDQETLKYSYMDVIKKCRAFVREIIGREISEQEVAIQLSKQHNQAKKTFTYVDEEVTGFDEVYQSAVKGVFDDLLAELNLYVDNPDIYHRIVVVGGAAEVWGDYFKKWSKRVQIPNDPQFAAARGMYKFGRYRVFELMEELSDEEIASAKE